MEKDLLNSLDVLKRGGIILYPTDTIWGIGCDATNPEAVYKVLSVKNRQDDKGLLILVDDPEKLTYFVAEIPEIAWELVSVTDQPITVVYHGGINLPASVLHSDGSVGIRVTNDVFCKELIRRLGKPLISTSANKSGKPFPSTFADIEEDIKTNIDYIVKWRQNDVSLKNPSSIIKLGPGGEIEIIRPGIPETDNK